MGFKHAYSFKYCDKGQIIFNLTDFISCIKWVLNTLVHGNKNIKGTVTTH